MRRVVTGNEGISSLTTQKQLRQVRDLRFCYWCGEDWVDGDDADRDHVPPKRLFAVADRTPPLILPTHVRCNNGHSAYDEQIGQLVSLLWKEDPSPKDASALRVSAHENFGGSPFCATEGLDLQRIIGRWIRAFHAALYHEPLSCIAGELCEPFPGGDQPGEDTNLHPFHGIHALEVKMNRAAGRVDTIIAYNSKLRYECVWKVVDETRPICTWALDLYSWHRLGDTKNFVARSCVGWYEPRTGIPECASRAVTIEVPFQNFQPLNAFE